ncbi:hypothetical protein NLU13_7974 [Sarocladium strictum]|uniref:Zn(2)-C6 fungal-type domain-containing protein n=1 Tax=Sarocladium strictum TaxID=5046 RepID=A0AA39L4I8_SARSR|nr:hypothetical protein NLU13_7974 [Sarocladium strictum]
MDDSPGSAMGHRGEKRPLPQQHFQIIQEPSKRRAPYATQACDACRRRKGRCDGQKPCDYCHQRSLDCKYSAPSDRKQETAQAPQSQDASLKLVQQLQLLLQQQQQQLQPGQEPRRDAASAPATLTELGGLVTSLQDQVTALASIVENHQRSTEPSRANSTSSSRSTDGNDNHTSLTSQLRPNKHPVPMSDTSHVSSLPGTAKRTKLPFYGPTSPEFSLIAAKNKLSQEKDQSRNPAGETRGASSLCEDMSDEEDHESAVLDDSGYGSPPKPNGAHQPSPGLLHFTNVMSKTEAIRLLSVYQEIIGEIHPICDIESLTSQLDRWFGWLNCTTKWDSASRPNFDMVQDTDELLILNLALTTAMSAEAVSRSSLAKQLYEGFKHIVLAKLVAPVNTEKDVAITLMMGFYAYFNCELHTAWRMCGLAGRMAMQLGMHSRDMTQRMEREGCGTELATLTCSLVVLDRQLSAASGLPPNFNFADFDSALPNATQTPYLKAMMSFTLMSDQFNVPISRAARGESCDEECFDVTVFKVEQWRKRTLETPAFSQPASWESNPSTRPPSWMTMLYLRANAVRTILLRPYFISSASPSANAKIKSALELITDTVTTLSILDRASDTYRRQHPQFQHFLASSCALLFLLVAYVTQNHSSCQSDLPEDYTGTVSRIFRDALSLSAAYRDLSPASRKLWKRLITMRELLVRKNILPRDLALAKDGASESNASFTDHNGNNLGINANAMNDLNPRISDNGARPYDGQLSPQIDLKRSTLQLSQQNLEFAESNSNMSMYEMPHYGGMRRDDLSTESMDFATGEMFSDFSGIADCFGLEWSMREGTTDFFTDGL